MGEPIFWWQCAPGLDVERIARSSIAEDSTVLTAPWIDGLLGGRKGLGRRPRDVANLWLRQSTRQPLVLVTRIWTADDVAVLGCLASRTPLRVVSAIGGAPPARVLEGRVAEILAQYGATVKRVDWATSHLASAREAFPLAPLLERWLERV